MLTPGTGVVWVAFQYSVQFNSIQFSGYLLTCRLNSRSSFYKAKTKTKIKHKNSTITQKLNTKNTKQNKTLMKK
jgi:hypothetical protein